MGLSVVISGAIISVALLYVLFSMSNFTDNLSSIEESASQISSIENTILQTDMKINSITALSNLNQVNFTLVNTGAETLWDFDSFDLFITYDADISGVATRITEKFPYNGSAAFGVGFGSAGSPVFERPDNEQSGGWASVTGCPVPQPEDCINENSQSDAEFITSSNLGTSDTDVVEFSLSDVLNPGINTDHIVRYTYRELNNPNDPSFDVRLLQGVTVIASWNHPSPLPIVFTLAVQPLTTIQASAITDYNDLRLEFTATCDATCNNPGGQRDNVEVSWAELEVPSLGTSQWTVNSITNDLIDSQILNEQEAAEVNAILTYAIFPNSIVSIVISSDNGIVTTSSQTIA